MILVCDNKKHLLKEQVLFVCGMRRRSSLPGRYQPSTFDVLRLNFCVRYGNRWNPQAIATAKSELIWCFASPSYCSRSVSWSHSSLPVALLFETSQPLFALGFAQAPTGCALALVAAKSELIWCFALPDILSSVSQRVVFSGVLHTLTTV